jgi:hypothetical protein
MTVQKRPQKRAGRKEVRREEIETTDERRWTQIEFLITKEPDPVFVPPNCL